MQPQAHRSAEVPVNDEFPRGIAVTAVTLLIALAFSLLPLHDDWEYEISPSCSLASASSCKAMFLTCRSYMFSGSNPRTGIPAPSSAGAVQSTRCFNERYTAECGASCGMPVATGSWWHRMQAYGPWYLKLLPGARSWWSRVIGSEDKERLIF